MNSIQTFLKEQCEKNPQEFAWNVLKALSNEEGSFAGDEIKGEKIKGGRHCGNAPTAI